MTTSRIPGKSPGIKTMQKETVSNNSCRICRIDLKIKGWSNMNALDITLSSVLSRSDVDDTMRLSQKICQKCKWEVLKFWIGKIQGKMLWGTKKSVGKLPLEMIEALREWFSGIVSRPTEKKSALPELPKPIRRTLIPKKTTEKENYELWHFTTCDLLFNGGQKTRKQLWQRQDSLMRVIVKQMAWKEYPF